MESRVMGVIGNRKGRISGKDQAARSSTFWFQRDHLDPISSRRCERMPEPGSCEHTANGQLIPPLRRSTGIHLGYHTDDGIEGEAPGSVIAKDRVYVATSVLPSSGTSVILAVREEALSNGIEVIAGNVTAVFPKADEYGFPPGFGVSVTEGAELLEQLMTSPKPQPTC